MSNQAAAREKTIRGSDHLVNDSALGIVNPSSGLANDYLNVFNEILLLLEFLPTMPEMTGEALAWRPRGYREYFQQSPLPGASEAVRSYETLDPDLRDRFESILRRLNDIAQQAQCTVAEEMAGPNFPQSIVDSCESTAAAMRAGLQHVARLINEGPVAASRGEGATISSGRGN
jgi:hypothetical protein